MNIAFLALPLFYLTAIVGAAIFAFRLLVRFVRAHERAAAALEALARRDR